MTWRNQAVELPKKPSQTNSALNPEAVKTVEALRKKLQADVGKQIEQAGAGKFAEKMVADCTYHGIKKGITADNLGKTFVDTTQNKIFIASRDGLKFAAIDAFEAAKTEPGKRLQEAAQAKEQQMQEQSIKLTQQRPDKRRPHLG